MMFIIPRWNDLLGTSFKGFYANRIVSNIHLDSVIMFSSLECSITEKTGTSYLLFGCGLYFLKFELDNRTYIIDQRELNGLLLSDFVYDYMATAPQVTLENDDDVIMNELAIKIPIDLSNKSPTKKTFIRGVLMRNVFVPYKEVILRMLEQGQKKGTYDIEQTGYKLLSSHPGNFNRILLSEAFRFDKSVKDYIKPTAGVSNIHFLADKILNEFFSPEELTTISNSISSLKNIIQRIKIEPGFLFSILELINKELSNK